MKKPTPKNLETLSLFNWCIHSLTPHPLYLVDSPFKSVKGSHMWTKQYKIQPFTFRQSRAEIC